jgi:hypothetical protein
MNSIMERWIGSCRRELLDRTLVWNQRHLMAVLREYEDFYNTHRLPSGLTAAGGVGCSATAREHMLAPSAHGRQLRVGRNPGPRRRSVYPKVSHQQVSQCVT